MRLISPFSGDGTEAVVRARLGCRAPQGLRGHTRVRADARHQTYGGEILSGEGAGGVRPPRLSAVPGGHCPGLGIDDRAAIRLDDVEASITVDRLKAVLVCRCIVL